MNKDNPMHLNRSPKIFANLRHDLPASVVVFFVALPLCLGIALASGAPLFSGVIAGIVGGIVIGSLSNSSLGVSGPAAGLTVIVLTAIETLGSFQIFLAAVVLAGVIQIGLGVVKAGIIGYYFPSAVIKGMLTAIGIIIVLKQIPHAFGYDADYEGDLAFNQRDGENSFTEIVRMLDSIEPGAIVVSIIGLFILFLWEVHMTKRYSVCRVLQGPLVVVVAGICYQFVTSNYFPEISIGREHLVAVPVADSLTGFFSQFTFPDFGSAITRNDVWVAALTIAIVASLESLLSVEATDKLDPLRRVTNTNRELMAQGTGNIVSGLIGGLPLTQVILRSTANIQSGARTRLSAIIHGILLLVCVAAIPQILNLVPLAALAAILLVIGYKLANPSVIRHMYRQGWSQFLPFIATVVGVVSTDLLKGIGFGLAVSIIILLRNSYKNSHFLHRESHNGNRHIKMTLAEEVYFLNKGAVLSELNRIPNGSIVTIDMSRSKNIDFDVLELIDDYKKSCKEKDITINVITHHSGASNGKADVEAELVRNSLNH
jgi:MFS superfamily sulfate permease-like transporter